MTTMPRSTARSVLVSAVTALLATIAALVTLATSPASAVVFPGEPERTLVESGYFFSTRTFPFAAPDPVAGGELHCPNDHVPIAAGAVSSDPYGWLLAGPTTAGPQSVFASASGAPGNAMDVKTQCVRTARTAGSTTVGVTLRDRTTPPMWRDRSRTVTCPAGTVAFGGGGGVLDYDGYAREGMITLGSIPDQGRWTYAVTGRLGTRGLHVTTRCLPRERLGRIVMVTDTVTPTTTSHRPRVSGGARCPTGTFAYAGGAWWHGVDQPQPSWTGYLTASMMSADSRGWYSAGTTFAPEYARLTTRVMCTDRLG